MKLIDADALIEKCGEWYTEEGSEEGYIGTLKQLLDKQPTIEPKQGKWIDAEIRHEDGVLPIQVCSECKTFYPLEITSAPSIDIVRCGECRRVREDGGHANCNGYLYCRKWKTLVDEDGYCSWGEREGE